MTYTEFLLLPEKTRKELYKQFGKFKEDYFKLHTNGFSGIELAKCKDEFLKQLKAPSNS